MDVIADAPAEGQPHPGGDANSKAPNDPDGKDAWRARQAEQDAFRKSAALWLLDSPTTLPELVFVRMSLGLLATLMDSYLQQSGTKWDKKQWAKAAVSAASGLGGGR